MTDESPQPRVLQEADSIIHGDRREAYGSAEQSLANVWRLWLPIIESSLPGKEKVALCLMQLKVARFIKSEDRDSVVDMAGYAGCLAQIMGWDD